MGLLVLIAVGAGLGWLFLVMFDQTKRTPMARDTLIGIAGSLIGGIAAAGGPMFSTITGESLFAGIVGALMALGISRAIMELATS